MPIHEPPNNVGPMPSSAFVWESHKRLLQRHRQGRKTDKRSLLLYFYVFSWNIIVNEFLFSLSFYLLCRFWFQLTTRHIYCKPICKSVELYFSSRSGIFRKFQIYGSERIKSQSVGIAAHEEKMVRKEICWLVPFVCIQVDGPNVPPIIPAAASKIFFRLFWSTSISFDRITIPHRSVLGRFHYGEMLAQLMDK